jgi:hypothetical protein
LGTQKKIFKMHGINNSKMAENLREFLKKLLGPNREKVTGDWEKLQNEELRNLCSSPNVISMIKPRSMGQAGRRQMSTESWGGYLEDSEQSEDTGLGG